MYHMNDQWGELPLEQDRTMISPISDASMPVNRLIAALGSGQTQGVARHGRGESVDEVQKTPETPTGKSELTDEERKQVEDLQKRDVEVRRHEAAHKAAAGSLAGGGPSFETQQGPDGRSYAVGGEVSIDTSPVEGDPQATILKMQQIRAAALAPANPSAQDRQVAAAATRAEQQARAESSQESAEAQPDESRSTAASSPAAASSSPFGASRPTSPVFSEFQSAFAAQTTRPPGRFIDVAV